MMSQPATADQAVLVRYGTGHRNLPRSICRKVQPHTHIA
jgi:hypothetical protein